MSKLDLNSDTGQVLDDDVVDALGENLVSERQRAERVNRLYARVMSQIDEDSRALPNSFETIRMHDGDWIEVMPHVTKKVLQVDHARGIESYLMRIEPGTQVPSHVHDSDELCYVIEGDLAFGDILLETGDYHFAHKGSTHGEASTVNGVLLFLQTGLGGERYDGIKA